MSSCLLLADAWYEQASRALLVVSGDLIESCCWLAAGVAGSSTGRECARWSVASVSYSPTAAVCSKSATAWSGKSGSSASNSPTDASHSYGCCATSNAKARHLEVRLRTSSRRHNATRKGKGLPPTTRLPEFQSGLAAEEPSTRSAVARLSRWPGEAITSVRTATVYVVAPAMLATLAGGGGLGDIIVNEPTYGTAGVISRLRSRCSLSVLTAC